MLKNKYLRCSPDITFEIFKKIWDNLIETGWKPFTTSTNAKDMYEKWSKDCILTYGPSYSPNTFSIYNEDATLSDDVEVFVGDLIQSSQKLFILPPRWYVVVTEENAEVLSRWRWPSDSHKLGPGQITGICETGDNGQLHPRNRGHNPRQSTSSFGDFEITYEQFQKYVLKEDSSTFPENWNIKMTPEIRDYLQKYTGLYGLGYDYTLNAYYGMVDGHKYGSMSQSAKSQSVTFEMLKQHLKLEEEPIKGYKTEVTAPFVLPTNWYVSLNEVSRETLERYVKRKFHTIKGYIYVGGSWSASIHEGYTEISLEQFTEHVVKEKVTEKETFCVQGDGSSWFGKMILDYLKDKGGRGTHAWEYAATGYFNIDDNSDINWLGDSPVGRVISKDEVMEHFCYKGAIKGDVGRHGKAVISHLKEKGATKNTDWTGCDSLFYYIVVKDGAYALEESALIPEGYHEVVLKKEVPSIYMGGIKGDGDRYYGKKVIQFLVKAGGKNLSGYMGSSVDKSVDKYYFINKEGVIEWSFSLPEDYTEVPRAEVEDAYVEEIEPVKDAPVPLVETYAKASLEPVIENITNIYFPKVEEIL